MNFVKDRLGTAYGTANKLIDNFVALGILDEITGAQRDRRFRYSAYLKLFDDTR